MTGRQRVIDAIDHKATALTPWAFETTRGFASLMEKEFGCADAEAYLESNVMFGAYKKTEWLSEDVYSDFFGVHWKVGGDGGDIGIPVNKLIGAENVDDFIFPSLDYTLLDGALEKMAADTQRFRMFRMTYAMYERAWALMGMEDTMLNMALYPDIVKRLLTRIAEYQLGILDYVLGGDFEGVYFGDDWGGQGGLIMGPNYWREFIKPQMKRLFDRVKSKGKYVLLHCCGNISKIFEDIIEIGCDVYNTVQPEIYDLEQIKAEYGDRLTFWGAMSTQRFLPFASAREVYDKSLETIRTLGEGGGYIFSPTHALTPDIPVENAVAMLRAVKDIKWQ